MKPRFKLTWPKGLQQLICAACFFCLYAMAVVAQSGSLRLENLLVEIWPEYDRPEVLIIYRVELSADTPLPAQVRFPLPGYIESMHVVAAEQNGALFEIQPEDYDLRAEGGKVWLTFTSSSRRVQFEYYDPTILTKQASARQLKFEFTAPYEITATTFEVQTPAQAENFSLTPLPGKTFTGKDGLEYHQIEVGTLAPDETFELSAAYERTTDDPSIDLLPGNNVSDPSADIAAGPTVEAPAVAPAPTTTSLTLSYVSIGVGIVLLLGAGYWWWADRTKKSGHGRRSPRKNTRRGQRRQGRSAAPPHRAGLSEQARPSVGGKASRPASAAGPASRFCYKCGTELRPDAIFCHNCGVERRQD